MDHKEPVLELNFYDLLFMFAKSWKLFVLNMAIAGILSALIALLLPKWYQATVIILPPGGSSSPLPSFLSRDLVGVASTFGFDMPADNIYQTILNSRTLKERIADKFDLRQVYHLPDEVYPEDVLEIFGSHLNITTLEDQSLAIRVEDRDPQRAADLANSCVAELDAIYSGITSETAGKNRVFIERRLSEIRDSMAIIQDSLENFQRLTGALSLPEQMQATLTAAAAIKAEKMANDVRLEVLKNNLGRDHPSVAQLRAASVKLEFQYQQMLAGSEGEMFIGMGEFPTLGRRLTDFYRALAVQSKLLEFIYPQYESARIQEERESANVQVLDPAKPPHRKHRPPRKLIVLTAVFAAIVFTITLRILSEYWKSLPVRNQEDWRRIQRFLSFFHR